MGVTCSEGQDELSKKEDAELKESLGIEESLPLMKLDCDSNLSQFPDLEVGKKYPV